jgi:hypothetical protein
MRQYSDHLQDNENTWTCQYEWVAFLVNSQFQRVAEKKLGFMDVLLEPMLVDSEKANLVFQA